MYNLHPATVARITVLADDLEISPEMVVDMATKALQFQLFNEDVRLTPVYMPRSEAKDLPTGYLRASETLRDWAARSKGRS